MKVENYEGRAGGIVLTSDGIKLILTVEGSDGRQLPIYLGENEVVSLIGALHIWHRLREQEFD